MNKGILIIIIFLLPTFALDPKGYFNLEKQLLQLAVERLQDQIECCKKGCTRDKIIAISSTYQMKIEELFTSYNTTPSKWSAYYTSHKKELDTLYRTNFNKTLQPLQNKLKLLDEELKECKGE